MNIRVNSSPVSVDTFPGAMDLEAASQLGLQLDRQIGTKVATTTINGQAMLGVDFLRGLGAGQWGYIAFDPVELTQTAIKFFQGQRLTPKDVVPLRIQVEAGFEGLAKIPGIGERLVALMKEEYPNTLQGDVGFIINLKVSGRRDGKSGVEVKSLELLAYTDPPAPAGLVQVSKDKVSAGGLDKNFTNISGGISYTAEQGFQFIAPAVMHGKIADLRKPPNATNTSGTFFDGWTVVGVTASNDDGAIAGRTIIANGVSGMLPGKGESTASKVLSGAGLVADGAVLTDAIVNAMNGKKKILSNGKPEEITGIGVVMGVIRPPGPRMPGPVPMVRMIGTVTATQDGSKKINFEYNGRRLFTTSLPEIQSSMGQALKALEEVPIVGALVKPAKKPDPATFGSPYNPEQLKADSQRQQQDASRKLLRSVQNLNGGSNTQLDRVDVTINGQRFHNVPALPGAAVAVQGMAPIAVSELIKNVANGRYSGSRADMEGAYKLISALPAGTQRDQLAAELMTGYMHGALKAVQVICDRSLKTRQLSVADAETLIDVNNLLKFSNQLRQRVGAVPIQAPNLESWAKYAQTVTPPPGATVSAPGQASIPVSELIKNVSKSRYSGSRADTEGAYKLIGALPEGILRDNLRAVLMTDYTSGALKAVQFICDRNLKTHRLSVADANTLVDVNKLLQFTNQLRQMVGEAPIQASPEFGLWVKHAQAVISQAGNQSAARQVLYAF